MGKSRYLLLALILWLGQAVLLVHATDLDAHTAADTCDICVHASPTDSALPSASLPLPPPCADEGPLPFDYRTPAAARSSDATARGPPAFS